MWVPDPWDQNSGNIFFIEKPGVQEDGVGHVAKHSSDPRIAYPEVNVQVRDLVRVVGIVATFASRGPVLRENSFYRATGVNGHRRPVPGAPSSGTPRESSNQAKFRDGAEWGL